MKDIFDQFYKESWRNFVNFVKNLLFQHFLLFLVFYISLITAQVQISTHSVQPPAQKLLFLNLSPVHPIVISEG